MPALPLALVAFAAGVVLLQWQPVLPAVAPWLGGAFVAAIGAAGVHALRRRVLLGRIAATVFALVAAGAFGFGYAAWRAEVRLADALPAMWEGEDIALVGVIDDLPQASPRSTRFVFAVERVETAGAVVPGKLSLAWYAQWQKGGPIDTVPGIAAGERWRLVVRLKRPHGTVNPNGFDVEAWLLENGLRATGYVRTDDANVRLAAFAGRPSDYVQRARAAVRERVLAALPDAPYAGVIVALTIGEERAVSEAQWQVFSRTGITHLISISGLHVTVFAAIAGGLALALARRSPRLTTRIPAHKVAAVVGVSAAAAYVLLAGSQVPAVRTLLMLGVAAAGLALARPGTAAVVWLWALAAVLAWDPWAGFSAGFWLSFGAVGLLLYAHVGRLASPPPASRVGRIIRTMRTATRAQALVTIGLVPGTLALFQQVSLISPIANALAIPAVTFVVVPLSLLGIVCPVGSAVRGGASCLCRADGAARLDGDCPRVRVAAACADRRGPSPSPCSASRGLRPRAACRVARSGSSHCCRCSSCGRCRPLRARVRMTVLDVGQGLAVVVETHAHALLYDTGPRFSDDADAGGRIVAPFLRAAGIRALDAMIVTHQDSDHSGGALSVLRTVPVGWLSSSLPADHAIVLHRVQEGGEVQRCEAGERWDWDGVRFTVLQPTSAHYAMPRLKPNDLSCVVRVDSAWGSVLLTGDLEARGELELVRHDAAALKSDVLLVPHHGSKTSSTPAFIAAAAPVVAVYTPGYRNRFGHPRPEIVARYDEAGITSFRTDYDGALTFVFAPGASRLPQAQRAVDQRYWRDVPVRDGSPLD